MRESRLSWTSIYTGTTQGDGMLTMPNPIQQVQIQPANTSGYILAGMRWSPVSLSPVLLTLTNETIHSRYGGRGSQTVCGTSNIERLTSKVINWNILRLRGSAKEPA